MQCALCNDGKERTKLQLYGHVRFGHKGELTWTQYKQQYLKETTTVPSQLTATTTVQPTTGQPATTQGELQPLTQPAGSPDMQNQINQILTSIQQLQQQVKRNNGEPEDLAETVTVETDWVSRKISLNPDIFWRFSIFKAQNKRLVEAGVEGVKPFTGDLGDFLDMATADLLASHNLFPTVVSYTKGKMMVEIPTERG